MGKLENKIKENVQEDYNNRLIRVCWKLSFLFGTTNSFILNRSITFRSKKKPLFEGIKYFSVWILSFFVNSFIHDITTPYFNGYLPFIIASIASIAINFLGAKFWVFKK